MDQAPPLSASEVRRLLAQAGLPDAEEAAIEINSQHSNLLAVVRYGSGDTLMMKRARYSGMASRFETSRAAARLLHEQTDLLVPRYLDPPGDAGQTPMLVYWWIPDPTLEDVWDEIGPDLRERALTECGRLLRRIHAVRLPGHGPLLESLQGGEPLAAFLRADLLTRLRPAVEASWPDRDALVDRLSEAFSHALDGRAEPPAVLVHNDLFSANVLCERGETGLRCVGVLDFEDSFAGPAEADLAKAEVLHGPLFGRPLGGGWFRSVLRGYEEAPDARLLALFRAYHLLNMGYHAAVTGLTAHADQVAAAIERELDQWTQGRRHAEVLA